MSFNCISFGDGYVVDNLHFIDFCIPASIEHNKHFAFSFSCAGIVLIASKSSLFKRSDENLFFEFPISIADAALGTTIEIPTIDGGKAKIKIPDGTQSGKQFRLKGKGMPFMRRGDFGDLYVQVNTEVPISLNKQQKELLACNFIQELDKKNKIVATAIYDKDKIIEEDVNLNWDFYLEHDYINFISYPYETAFPLHLSFCWHSTGFASPILCVLW